MFFTSLLLKCDSVRRDIEGTLKELTVSLFSESEQRRLPAIEATREASGLDSEYKL